MIAANGNAIYSFSRVVIFASHLNWVMRGRAGWVGNVVTHELSHVFSSVGISIITDNILYKDFHSIINNQMSRIGFTAGKKKIAVPCGT